MSGRESSLQVLRLAGITPQYAKESFPTDSLEIARNVGLRQGLELIIEKVRLARGRPAF